MLFNFGALVVSVLELFAYVYFGVSFWLFLFDLCGTFWFYCFGSIPHILAYTMFTLVLVVLGYYAGSLLINYVFSLKLGGFVSLVSYNFECGFVSSLSTHIRFKLNYWLIIINFIIFELEVLLSVLYIFSVVSYLSYLMFLCLLILLFFDLYY